MAKSRANLSQNQLDLSLSNRSALRCFNKTSQVFFLNIRNTGMLRWKCQQCVPAGLPLSCHYRGLIVVWTATVFAVRKSNSLCFSSGLWTAVLSALSAHSQPQRGVMIHFTPKAINNNLWFLSAEESRCADYDPHQLQKRKFPKVVLTFAILLLYKTKKGLDESASNRLNLAMGHHRRAYLLHGNTPLAVIHQLLPISVLNCRASYSCSSKFSLNPRFCFWHRSHTHTLSHLLSTLTFQTPSSIHEKGFWACRLFMTRVETWIFKKMLVSGRVMRSLSSSARLFCRPLTQTGNARRSHSVAPSVWPQTQIS